MEFFQLTKISLSTDFLQLWRLIWLVGCPCLLAKDQLELILPLLVEAFTTTKRPYIRTLVTFGAHRWRDSMSFTAICNAFLLLKHWSKEYLQPAIVHDLNNPEPSRGNETILPSLVLDETTLDIFLLLCHTPYTTVSDYLTLPSCFVPVKCTLVEKQNFLWRKEL